MRHERLKRIAGDPISRLRRLRGDVEPDISSVRSAITRLSKDRPDVGDWAIFFDWMIAQSYGKTLAEDASDSALRANEVRKRFLDQISSLIEEPSAKVQSPTPTDPPRRKRGR
jgi:hypothetical protein